MKSELNAPHLHNEEAAFAYVEARLWPNGPVCPKCGTVGRAGRLRGESVRPGLWKCYACRKQFTVRVGTIFESSHVPMHIWLQAFYLMASSKKGISTRQLQRTFGGSMKTAWFLSHRIREAMKDGGTGPLGGGGSIVEADETYFGSVGGPEAKARLASLPVVGKRKRSIPAKRAVVSLVERGGRARTFHVGNASKEVVQGILRLNVAPDSVLNTDESRIYGGVIEHFADHQTIRHISGEYVRGDVTTNTVEGFFSVFKRGMRGIYQHCGEKHLHRYLAEFDFRYNHRVRLGVDDVQRTAAAVRGAAGKRLTYQTTRG